MSTVNKLMLLMAFLSIVQTVNAVDSTQDVDTIVTDLMQLTPEQQDQLIAKLTHQRESNKAGTIQPRQGVKLSRLPTAVGTPSYSGVLKNTTSATFTFWREVIDGKSRLFLQIQPTTAAYFFFCSSSSTYSLIQNGVDYINALRVTRGNDVPFCDNVTTATIFLVDQSSSYDNFNESGAFSFTNYNRTATIQVAGTSTSTTTTTTTPVTGTYYTSDDLPIIYQNLDIEIPIALYLQNSASLPPTTIQTPVYVRLKYAPLKYGDFTWTLDDVYYLR